MTRHICVGAFLATTMVAISGCGPSLSNVKGVVKLDGSPVDGATVVFVSEDGKSSFSGQSDASGKFSISSADGKSGIPAGTYKVVVTKRAALGGGEMSPDSPEAKAAMMKDSSAAGKGGPKVAMPGMKMPMPGATGGGVKSDLPIVYASTETTPIKVKVPSDQEIAVDLKSK